MILRYVDRDTPIMSQTLFRRLSRRIRMDDTLTHTKASPYLMQSDVITMSI